MSSKPRVLVTFAACGALVAACSSGGPTEPGTTSVAGGWNYSATNLSGSGLSCSISGSRMTLNQTGSSFTGTATGGSLTCLAGGDSETVFLGTSQVVNGQVSGSSVSFDIDTSDFHHTGTVSGGSMSGTVTARLDLGAPIGVIVLVGNWAAGRG